jgi:hypothetical protein
MNVVGSCAQVNGIGMTRAKVMGGRHIELMHDCT